MAHVKGNPMLQTLTDRVLYAPGGVNIGVVLDDADGAIMIDTGLNDTAARKVLRDVAALGRHVTSIVTTHGHADHFGGNAFVVRRTGATVFAPEWDEAVLRYPLFQPLCLYAGADPPLSLRGGFLLADASPVDTTYRDGTLEVSGVVMQSISLKGHSGNQMGILIDGVFFAADVVLPERVLTRYRIPYLYSVTDHLASLDRADTVPHMVAVPGHGPILDHVSEATSANRDLVERVATCIVELCRTPRTPEDLLADVLIRFGANPIDAAGYYLLHPTIFAYLSHLERTGAVRHEIDRGRSLWTRH
jgi:glyoxylase-like metal-dependent hydrolase (beta-lactamase superfamily II)